ncbi:MAG TPA: DUF1302 family protein [Nevskiaceae bacterium]|nr:DUF1302 family protein [Nevskiaceae bacterium]
MIRFRHGLAAVAAGFCASASAHNFDLPLGFEGEWKLTGNYAVAVRTKNPSPDLIDGEVDPLNVDLSAEAVQNGQAFGHTGLPTTMNFDDGDRNFRKWSLVHNRLSLFGEFQLRSEHIGGVVSGDAFYDQAYHRTNRNDSPETINKLEGPNNEFNEPARFFDGGFRARLLEAYAYTDWNLFDEMPLDVRVGQHVAAWGESLFLSGIMLAQGRADATRAYVPGAEIKEILLPVNQVSASFAPIPEINLLGYYHLEFRPTEIFPIGDFLAVQDLVGPGGEFTYGSVNPLYFDGCPGVISSILGQVLGPAGLQDLALQAGGSVEQLCHLNGIGGPVANAPPYILVYRKGDIRPSSSGGQWGTGMKWQVTPVTNIGFYYLRYDDTNPSVTLDMGYAPIGSLGGQQLTTSLFNQVVPIYYHVTYASGIHLMGTSFSTVLGPFNVAGEVLYRDNVPTSARAYVSQELSPWGTRGRIGQMLLSGIFVGNPKFIYDDFIFVGEAGWFHLFGMDPIQNPGCPANTPVPGGPNLTPASCGVQPVGGGVVPFYDRDSVGFQFLAFADIHNIFSGWDMKNQIAYGEITHGTPSLTAAFGALYAQGDRRLGLSCVFTYLQNLELGASYNFFFGSPSANLNESTLQLRSHPYADRDYASINIKYNF